MHDTESRQPAIRAVGDAPAWAWAAGTFFGAGYLRPGPGTWASLAAVAIWSAMAMTLPAGSLWVGTLACVLVAVVAGIPAATRLGNASGNHDPSYVVIDEVAGQMLALVCVPAGWKSALAGLILFRAFDIWKPSPLRLLEKLPGGFGVMLDDVGAGLYALVMMQVLVYWGVLG